MKRFICLILTVITFFQLCAQNKIELGKNQKTLIDIPESIGKKYTDSQFIEAYQYNGNTDNKDLKGIYCVFEDKAVTKKQNSGTASDSEYEASIFYIETNGRIYRDILFGAENNIYYPQVQLKTERGREYLKFDNTGRMFLSVSGKSEKSKGIFMYSAADDSKNFFWIPKEYSTIEDFAVSDDGKYIVVNALFGEEFKTYQSFIFETARPMKNPEKLLYMNASKLSSVVYNPENQSFYMIASFFDSAVESDEMGKMCILRRENDSYTDKSVQYFSQKQIENGSRLDFWYNVFVIDQIDNRLYAATNFGNNSIVDGTLLEVTDEGNSVKFKPVEKTSEILFHSNSYFGDAKILKSTPVGLYLRDKNENVYLYRNQEAVKTTEEDVKEKVSNYNRELFNRTAGIRQNSADRFVIEEKDEQIETLKNEISRRNKLYIFVIVLLSVISAVLVIILIIIESRKKLYIRKVMQKKMLELQETERAKLSRDIHDSVVQDIRAIRLQTELIDAGENPKSLMQKERVIEDITQTIVKMRNICYNLTPAELITHQEGDSAEIELISVIDTLCQQFFVKTKIPCSLQIEENLVYPKYDKETSLHLVRVFQELLNNIEKHSYATNVNVLIRNKIEENQNQLVIFVIDDGIGCDIQQVLKTRRKNHFGLNNIQERISLIGGKIEFYSSQNEGMKIKITVRM